MRDPWFPIALMLIVLIGVWLGIFGPMPNGFVAWLQSWQTLVAAFVALFAAVIALRNTSKTIRQTATLESNRRSRKHAALRAVLPIALSQVTAYARKSAQFLGKLWSKCDGEMLPDKKAPPSLAETPPTETLKTFAEFIEYSDQPLNVEILEATVASIQIHDSRINSLVHANHDQSSSRTITRDEIEKLIIDAASIYAGANALFDYARRRQSQLPITLTWDDVRKALQNMQFWDWDYPRLYESISRLEEDSTGPFDNLRST